MITGNILLVEDEDRWRGLIRRIFSLEGYNVYESPDIRTASRILKKQEIDLVVCDINLPDGNGLDIIQQVKNKTAYREIVFLTAFANVADGVQAIKLGAYDYIAKSEDNYKLISIVGHAMEKALLQKRVFQLESQGLGLFGFNNIIGISPQLKETVALAKKVAPTNTTVLLLGETGTGKELFARAIHTGSPRVMYPFLSVNCSNFSGELLESELFGYKAGAFTGAAKDKQGLIEAAAGGTLFLDEIGEMPLDLQVKLLRVLESNEYFKLGDTRPLTANVRIVSATNRNLQREVECGRFREDLFYRLNVFSINIPALRDRKLDIPILADYFMKLFAGKMNKAIDSIDKDCIEYLRQHAWQGNIRELKNAIERAVIMTSSNLITKEDLPLEMRQSLFVKKNDAGNFELETAEKNHIQWVLECTNGNRAKAARLMKVALTTLYRKMKQYHLL
jgi:DNA-binding NtrC family response regulator